MVERAAKAAGFEMKIHPHMLRHACGFKLANEGVDTRSEQAHDVHLRLATVAGKFAHRFVVAAPLSRYLFNQLTDDVAQPMGLLLPGDMASNPA